MKETNTRCLMLSTGMLLIGNVEISKEDSSKMIVQDSFSISIQGNSLSMHTFPPESEERTVDVYKSGLIAEYVPNKKLIESYLNGIKQYNARASGIILPDSPGGII